MPLDVYVEYTDGSTESFYIPYRLMWFEKENPTTEIKRTILDDWSWENPTFDFEISKNKATIKKITIDPSGLMADVKQTDNTYEIK